MLTRFTLCAALVLGACGVENGDYADPQREEGLFEIVAVKPGDSSSSVDVKVTILHGGKEVTTGSLYFDRAVAVKLSWSCHRPLPYTEEGDAATGMQESKKITVNIPKGSGSVTTTLTDLPGRPQADDDFEVHCSVEVQVDIIAAATDAKELIEELRIWHNDRFWKVPQDDHVDPDDKEKPQGNIHKFKIEKTGTGSNGLTIKAEVTRIDAGSSASLAEIKVSITKNGKPVAKGDAAFDESATVKLSWDCWGKISRADSQSEGETSIAIAAGKAEATATVELAAKRTDGGYRRCYLHTNGSQIPYHTTSLDGESIVKERSANLIPDRYSIIIGEHSYAVAERLNFAITGVESGKALSYSITNKGSATPLSTVDMHIDKKRGHDMLVQLAAAKNKIEYGRTLTVDGASNGRVFLHSIGSCELLASNGDGIERQAGTASVNSAPLYMPFTVRKNVTAESPTYRGKIWVFSYRDDAGESNLRAYLDASTGITSATKLKASAAANAGDAADFASGRYIAFAEKDGELTMHIFNLN